MKNIIIGVCAVLVVGIVGYKLMSSKGTTSDTVATTTPVATEVEKDMYMVDTSTSTVAWKGSFVSGVKSHTGTIGLKSGTGKIENGSISSGVFIFDMASIKDADGSAQLETHLKSDDFFNAEMYPEAKFELASLVATQTKDTFTASGKLTVRDVTKDISFPIMLTVEGANMIRAKGAITFNRADFNVKYGSSSFFKNLGDKVIADKVELSINLLTKPIEISQPQPPSSVQ